MKYTIDDAGCYVDGARGIYSTDAIVEFAERHGAAVPDCEEGDGHQHNTASLESRFAGCEFVSEIEDEVTDYMNDSFGIEGASWGRNDNGDWGLWTGEGK